MTSPIVASYTMSGQEISDITQYAMLADTRFRMARPPDSLGDPWNVKNAGQTVCGDGDLVSATGDDFAFIDAMKADVTQDQCLDVAHIYSTGFSMAEHPHRSGHPHRVDTRTGVGSADPSCPASGHPGTPAPELGTPAPELDQLTPAVRPADILSGTIQGFSRLPVGSRLAVRRSR